MLARIDEDRCIGCSKCIVACPVDAIVGAPQWMHTVIKSECIGCELCIAPCPVDCIEMISTDQPPFDKERAKQRVKARKQRLTQTKQIELEHYFEAVKAYDEKFNQANAYKNYIQAAVERVKKKRGI